MIDCIAPMPITTYKTSMLYRYWLVTIKCNQSTLLCLLALFFISVITDPATAIHDHVLCPPYYVYSKAGDNCLFILDSCGNSSYVRQRCREEAGTVIRWIENELHFNEICQFAQKRFTDSSSFYLGAHRHSDQDHFQWELTYTPVSFGPKLMRTDKGHECLEMTVSKSGCFITDTHCHKQTSPVCEFSQANPCLYNNGGCEGGCIPRHKGFRKCTCKPGMISIGPRCEKPGEPKVTCPSGTVHLRDVNACIGLLKEKYDQTNAKFHCYEKFRTTLLSTAKDRKMAVGEKFIKALKELTPETMFTVGAYYSMLEPRPFNWFQDKTVDTRSTQCPINDSKGTCVYLNTIDRCYVEDACDLKRQSLCEIDPPDECRNEPAKGNCPKGIPCVTKPGYRNYACEKPCKPGYYFKWRCVELDECKWLNGGCHHNCRNTIGSRECSCMDGYYLVNDTECRYKDKCMMDPSRDGCSKINIYKSKCKPNYHNDDTEQRETSTFFIIFILIIVICFCAIAFAAGYYKIIDVWKKQQHQNPGAQSTSLFQFIQKQLTNEPHGTPSLSQNAEIVSTSVY